MERDITITFTKGMWWWKRTYQKTFRGSGTVWRDIETGQRPSIGVEIGLSEIDWLDRQKEQGR